MQYIQLIPAPWARAFAEEAQDTPQEYIGQLIDENIDQLLTDEFLQDSRPRHTRLEFLSKLYERRERAMDRHDTAQVDQITDMLCDKIGALLVREFETLLRY